MSTYIITEAAGRFEMLESPFGEGPEVVIARFQTEAAASAWLIRDLRSLETPMLAPEKRVNG